MHDVLHDQHKSTHADCEARDVNEGERFVAKDISPHGGQVILQHRNQGWLIGYFRKGQWLQKPGGEVNTMRYGVKKPEK
jgi:hypothetical protein